MNRKGTHGPTVAVYQTDTAQYPATAPFHPHADYPEYGFGGSRGNEHNPVYEAVRESLLLAGLDAGRCGAAAWNPLGTYIRPGQTVLLKPNWVRVGHPRALDGWQYTVTHGSVIRAVADYVWKALEGRGRIIVADGPQTDQSFSAIADQVGMHEVQAFYEAQGLNLDLVDFRGEEWVNEGGVIVARRTLPGDPNGTVLFNLGERSEFEGHGGTGRYYGADYDTAAVNSHHRPGWHEYLIAGTSIACDVFINLPKLKTHKKAGITVNLKNLVGVNADKNYLPHHTEGAPTNGGDQYPTRSLRRRVEHAAASRLRAAALQAPAIGTRMLRRGRNLGKVAFGSTDDVVRSGNWHGNDTVWRMCLDLNKLVLYGNADGSMREDGAASRKTYLSFVDGIIGGDRNGPMDPDPVAAGLLLFGTNPGHVDAAAAVLMGFDPERIPIVRNAFRMKHFQIADEAWTSVMLMSNVPALTGPLPRIDTGELLPRFQPHFGWEGHVER